MGTVPVSTSQKPHHASDGLLEGYGPGVCEWHGAGMRVGAEVEGVLMQVIIMRRREEHAELLPRVLLVGDVQVLGHGRLARAGARRGTDPPRETQRRLLQLLLKGRKAATRARVSVSALTYPVMGVGGYVIRVRIVSNAGRGTDPPRETQRRLLQLLLLSAKGGEPGASVTQS
jgi:hypothetical protein